MRIMKESWQIDPQFRQEFLDFCELAASDDEVFKTFKENDRIKTIIENSTEDHKKKTIEWHNPKHPGDIRWWNDLTPTEVRYLYLTILIETKLFKNFQRTGDIVEIGGGYGGQCEMFQRISHTHGAYTIYDIPQVQKLQARFLGDHAIYPIFPDGIPEATEHDLLISWCAWSELDINTRKEYVEKVILKAKRFIICSNYNFYEDLGILYSYGIAPKIYSDELYSNIIYYER